MEKEENNEKAPKWAYFIVGFCLGIGIPLALIIWFGNNGCFPIWMAWMWT